MTKAKQKTKPTYIREVVIRYKKVKVKSDFPVGKSIKGAEQVVKLFSDLQNETKEKLVTISLNAALQIICFEVVSVGSVEAIYLRPIEAIRGAIPHSPHGIIIVHNHPSGSPEPSKADKKFTSQLLINTRSLGVSFLDHIIIGDGCYFSFAEKGLMEKL